MILPTSQINNIHILNDHFVLLNYNTTLRYAAIKFNLRQSSAPLKITILP